MNNQRINEICIDRYGSDVLRIGPICALWLAEFILAEYGVCAYRQISAMRFNAGQHTQYPPYGTAVFEAIR